MATSGSWEIEWQSSYWSSASNLKYYHWKGNWSKSGNTITLSNMTLWLTFTYSSSGSGTDNVTVTGGSAQSVTLTASGYSSNVASLNNTSFTVASSATSAAISCAIDGEVAGSTSIAFDPTITPPTGLTLTNVSTGTDSATGTITITGWGNGGSSSYRYLRMFLNNGGLQGRYEDVMNSMQSAITITNSSTAAAAGGLTFTPNTSYTLTAFAVNGNSQSDERSTSTSQTVVMLAESAAITNTATTRSTATFSYSTTADGGYYDKAIQYSLDGGATWVTAATVTGGSAATGSFTITGLTPNTNYSLQNRVTTTAGSSIGASVSFKTDVAFYGSVNGTTKIIDKMYGPIKRVAYSISSITNNSSLVASTLNDKFIETYGYMLLQPTNLQVTTGSTRYVVIRYGNSGNNILFSYTNGAYADEGVAWGWPSGVEPVNGSVYWTSAQKTMTKEIVKLYGSVNGVTKRVY